MLSRVANALYWMNRYLERAENTARIIESQLHMLLDLPAMRRDPNAWKPIVDITGDADYFTENIGDYTRENVIYFHTFDKKYPHSIISCLTAARENARSVREIITSEMWEKINNLYLGIAEPGADQEAAKSPHKFYLDIKMNSHLIIGIAYSTMAHGEAWHFSQLGRFLERADKTSRILDVKYFIILPRVDYIGSSLDNVQWTALLKSTSSLEMYRKRFNLISSKSIVDFLIFDRVFPRSVLYCITHAEQSLSKIYGASDELSSSSSLFRNMGKLKGKINFSHIDEVMGIGLHQFLDEIQFDLNTVGNEIHETFFALKPVSDSSSIGAQIQ